MNRLTLNQRRIDHINQKRSCQSCLIEARSDWRKGWQPGNRKVYAELMPQFKGNHKLLKDFLGEHKISIEPLDMDAVIVSANGWMRYLKRKARLKCPYCDQKLNLKEHFLSDFYIGGFASAKCSAILTRDRGIYKKYFPNLVGYENCLKASSSLAEWDGIYGIFRIWWI